MSPEPGTENKTERLHLLISPTEVEAIESWRYKNRVRTKGEAVRRLCQIGLAYHRNGEIVLKRSERALRATLLTMEKLEAALELAPKGIRGGLGTVLQEQIAALKAAMAAMVAASVLANGKNHSEVDSLIAQAEEQVEKLVTKRGMS